LANADSGISYLCNSEYPGLDEECLETNEMHQCAGNRNKELLRAGFIFPAYSSELLNPDAITTELCVNCTFQGALPFDHES